jgi:hypothetical protein
MHIPHVWAKVSADARFPDGQTHPVAVWGWGDDEASAKKGAADRLQRVLERIRCGETFPNRYGYGNRPLREEILQTFASATAGEPSAVLTRNSYGALVLNATRLLFLDIDLQPPSLAQRVLRIFGSGVAPEEAALAKLRDVLGHYGRATFRVYRTASGLRVMAIDRDFDPAGRDVQELMQATGTDPAFARLCQVQRSFRARLTPKPWRCYSSMPPGQHPRQDGELRQCFASWLTEYEKAAARFATCRYLETIGSGSPQGDAGPLQELHDRATRCGQSLPLA